MVKSSAKDVFKWAAGGGLIGGLAGFAVMFIGDLQQGPPGTTTLYQSMPRAALLIDAVFAVFTAVIGAGIGAVAEAVVHARRKRK